MSFLPVSVLPSNRCLGEQGPHDLRQSAESVGEVGTSTATANIEDLRRCAYKAIVVPNILYYQFNDAYLPPNQVEISCWI